MPGLVFEQRKYWVLQRVGDDRDRVLDLFEEQLVEFGV